MGGFGSGSSPHGRIKQTVEDGLKLDLGQLIRYQVLDPNNDRTGLIKWHRTRDGRNVASIGYCSDFKNSEICFIYTTNEETQDYVIQLTTTRPNYGGVRWWFLCPLTGKRTAKLYLPPGSRIFASRSAYNLNYQSQGESKSQRLIYRAHDLRYKLNNIDPGSGERFPRRPKGMHRKTYNQILNKIINLENSGWQLAREKLSQLLAN